MNTQLLYGIMVGAVAVLIGPVPSGYGAPWWAGPIAPLVVLYLTLMVVGRRTGAGRQATGEAKVSADTA